MFLTRAPLYSPRRAFSLDLHVLGLPPAFNLSHDQTLQFKSKFLSVLPLIFLQYRSITTRITSVITYINVDNIPKINFRVDTVYPSLFSKQTNITSAHTYYLIVLLNNDRRRSSCLSPTQRVKREAYYTSQPTYNKPLIHLFMTKLNK